MEQFDIFDNIQESFQSNNENNNFAANAESFTIVMPLVPDYSYPTEDLQPLLDLLKGWGLECVYQTLLAELIDLKVLKLLKDDDCKELLNKFSLGIRILFINNLENWKKGLLQNENMTATIQQYTPTTKTFQQQKSVDHNIDLGVILNSITTGGMIEDYYKINNRFNDNIRSLLVDAIISYIITKKMTMSVNLVDYIGDQIVSMFPSEVKDTYFIKYESNKNPKGKLYAKFYNSMRVLKPTGLVTSNVKNIDKPNSRKHSMHLEPEKDISYIVDQVKNDTSCPFSEVEPTTKFRLNEIQKAISTSDIINEWNSFTLPLGYRLVDIDFKTLYPDCQDLITTFEDKSQQIMNLIDEKIKDSSSRKLLNNLKDTPDISQNETNTVLFYLLHAIFVPTSKEVTMDHNGKINQVKHSIKDSQNTFMVFKNSVCEIEEYITLRRNEKNPIQPFILIVGSPMQPREIIVFFDCIKYKVFSILNAIDVCFKLIHLFNLEYPTESSIV
ncbi:C2H2-type domain-containing protein, partial [Aphis craccivora]